jgi:hypothetical protein
MNVNDMYRICQFAINKAQNGYLTPSEFNLIINQAQISYQDYLLGEFQQYQYGRPQARINYSQNEDIRQRLTPLIKMVDLVIREADNGMTPYPEDFVQVDAMYTENLDRIRFVSQDSLYSYYNSKIDPIETNPIYLIKDGNFQFYPITLESPKLSYISKPPEIVWAYITDENGRPIFAPYGQGQPPIQTPVGGSVNPVWADVDLLEIITRALKLIGLNLQAGQIEQYANQVTQTGQ